MAYSGFRPAAPGRAGAESDAVPLVVKTETVIAVGPGVVAGSIDPGLKLQMEALGSPLQLNVITPKVGSGASTLMTIVRGVAVNHGDAGLRLRRHYNRRPKRRCVSVAVLLVGFTSPPPETVALFVKLF